MSLFLGKVHFWLYDKIIWYEGLEQEIINWAKTIDVPVEEWMGEIYSKYGQPTGGRPLEEVVDTANIHGWLQDRISSTELRQSALVTKIINIDPDNINALINIFSKQGEMAAHQLDQKNLSPEEIYNALNNYILEGMPCDRAEMLLSKTNDEYVWRLTRCLHRQYWEANNGNIENFYTLRGAWLKAFVETINSELSYERSGDNMHRIFKK